MATSSSLLTPTPAATVTASPQSATVSHSNLQSHTLTQKPSSPATSYTPPPPPPPPQPKTTPSMPPPLQPQTVAMNGSSTSGNILDNFQTSNQNRTTSSSGPMSWSSNLLTPSSSTGLTAGLTGSHNMTATQTAGSTGLTAGLTGSQT